MESDRPSLLPLVRATILIVLGLALIAGLSVLLSPLHPAVPWILSVVMLFGLTMLVFTTLRPYSLANRRASRVGVTVNQEGVRVERRGETGALAWAEISDVLESVDPALGPTLHLVGSRRELKFSQSELPQYPIVRRAILRRLPQRPSEPPDN